MGKTNDTTIWEADGADSNSDWRIVTISIGGHWKLIAATQDFRYIKSPVQLYY